MKTTKIIHKNVFTLVAIVLFVTAFQIFEKLKVYGLSIASIQSKGGNTHFGKLIISR